MSTSSISLSPYSIQRPEKVRWIFPSTHSDVLSGVQSSSLRKFLKTSLQQLVENSITYTHGVITQLEYAKWYAFYSQNMEEREYDVLASKEFIEEKTAEGKTVEGIFLSKNGELIGGGIVVRKANEFASLAYKASLRISLGNQKNSSLGAVIDYLFLLQAKESGVKRISGGRSRNAFGVLNSLAHLEYKLRLGYIPEPDAESPLLIEVPIDEKKVVGFLGIKDGAPALYILKEENILLPYDFSRFDRHDLPYREIRLENI